jgi:hypothetical protein
LPPPKDTAPTDTAGAWHRIYAPNYAFRLLIQTATKGRPVALDLAELEAVAERVCDVAALDAREIDGSVRVVAGGS